LEKALLTGNCHDPMSTTMNFKAFASAQTCEINDDCDDGQGGMCFASPTILSCSRDNVLQLSQRGTRGPNTTTSTTLQRRRLLLLTMKPIPEILEVYHN
jgi:hypothetical protein